MSIYRTKKAANFTRLDNKLLQDKSLSLKARGLLALMLSLPDTWRFSIQGLCSLCIEQPTSIRAALKELEQAGYLLRKLQRDTAGKFESTFDIFEQPQSVPPACDFPTRVTRHGLTACGSSDAENHAEKTTKDITKKEKTTNLPTTEREGERLRFTPPSLDDVVQFVKERGDKINASRFFDYYSSVDWMIGKSRVKDWRAAVRNWERSEHKEAPTNNPSKILDERPDSADDYADWFKVELKAEP